jgi:hypothetical protein
MSCIYVDWLLAGSWITPILPTANQHKRMVYPILPTANQHKRMAYTTNCCIYRILTPDDEQSACSKHVEVNY